MFSMRRDAAQKERETSSKTERSLKETNIYYNRQQDRDSVKNSYLVIQACVIEPNWENFEKKRKKKNHVDGNISQVCSLTL